MSSEIKPLRPWRSRLHEIIFEADTPTGRAFDVLVIISILGSILAVMLESISGVAARYGPQLRALEWGFTILFTMEYLLRLIAVGKPAAYARSFFGVVDLLAVLPTYLSLLIPGSQALLVIRVIRVLRVFRVLKLVQFVKEATTLSAALRASMRKILVFLLAVLTMVVIMGSLMYIVEGEEHGFTSIPKSVYWAIVTLTTVGFGDITPQTPLGQFLSTIVMIMGYGIIAVPTGIVSVEMANAFREVSSQACQQCSAEGHPPGAKYCKDCGAELNPQEEG